MNGNLIKVRWVASSQVHPDLGLLQQGEEYDVPEQLGKAWCDQGAADPQTAEAHRVARGGKKPVAPAEEKE